MVVQELKQRCKIKINKYKNKKYYFWGIICDLAVLEKNLKSAHSIAHIVLNFYDISQDFFMSFFVELTSKIRKRNIFNAKRYYNERQ